jgi:hypothetical protein
MLTFLPRPVAARLRSTRLALALPALACLATPAAAGDLITQVQGTISEVSTRTPGVEDELAARGVVLGADVMVEFIIDSEAPLFTTVDPGIQVYSPAVTSAVVSVGSYSAVYSPSAGPSVSNILTVGNDLPIFPPFFQDTYVTAAPGTDTDDLLTGTGGRVNLVFGFGDINGSSMSDNGVVQDPGNFLIGSGLVSGDDGSITIDFDLDTVDFENNDDGGGGGQNGDDDPITALARKGQLAAASRFARRVLATEARFAKAPPTKDPLGQKQGALIDKASDAFGKQFLNAVNKALKKGGQSPLPASAKDAVVADLLEDLLGFSAGPQAGADVDDKRDRALRGKLLRAAARLGAFDLAAHSKNAAKPSLAKLLSKRAAGRIKLTKQVNKALAVAAKQGIVYSGPTPAQLADSIESLVDAFAELTEGD